MEGVEYIKYIKFVCIKKVRLLAGEMLELAQVWYNAIYPTTIKT